MSLYDLDDLDAYEKQLLLNAAWALGNSPRLNETQKAVIERKFQEIVDVYRSKEL